MENIFISLGASIVLVIVFASGIYNLYHERRRKRKEKEGNFLSELSKIFIFGRVQNFDDLTDFHEAHFGKSFNKYVLLNRLVSFLQRVKLKVATDVSTKQSVINSISEIIKTAQQRIDEEKKLIPFENVPIEEKNLLNDIIHSIDINTHVMNKFENLASLIINKEMDINRITLSENKSKKWAKWGIIATLITSALAIGLAIYIYQNPKTP